MVAIVTFILIEYGFGRPAIAQMPVRMLSLSLGAGLAVREGEIRNWRGSWLVVGFFVAALALFINQRLAKRELLTPAQLRTIQYFGFAAASTCFLAIVIGVEGRLADALRTVFSGRWIRGVGAISYGIYLYHIVIMHVLGLEYANWIGTGITTTRWALALALVFLVPTVSYWCIEKPILGLRHRFDRPRTPRAPARASQPA